MSMFIGSSAASARIAATLATPVNPALKEAWQGLAKALKSDDLDAARRSCAAPIKNAPEGATFTKGSPFAQLGKALVTGDMAAAKAAFATMVRPRLEGTTTPTAPTQDPPPTTNSVVTSSTGGSAGTVLNVSA
jgi:cytoskeletal protein RodZ